MAKICFIWKLFFQSFHSGPNLLLKQLQVSFNTLFQKGEVNSRLNITPFQKSSYQ